jgi:hypothetical protein
VNHKQYQGHDAASSASIELADYQCGYDRDHLLDAQVSQQVRKPMQRSKQAQQAAATQHQQHDTRQQPDQT